MYRSPSNNVLAINFFRSENNFVYTIEITNRYISDHALTH